MSYEFTKLSEVETTSELKEDDVILVVQDGTIKRYTGKVGGGSSVCYIEIAEGDITQKDGLDFPLLPHTIYDTVLNAINNNETILFNLSIMGMNIKINIIASQIVSDEMASEKGIPGGCMVYGFFVEGVTPLYIPSKEFEYVPAPPK